VVAIIVDKVVFEYIESIVEFEKAESGYHTGICSRIQEILQLNEDTGGRYDSDISVARRFMKQCFGQCGGGFVAIPELTRIPIFGKVSHAQWSAGSLIFCLCS
jgi:hypothetical protein